MARITKIGLQNFRVFKDMQNIELAPITILTGPNNSGKSSVLKALQLFSGNAKKNNLVKLDFNLPEEKHNLGSYENVLNDINREFCFIYEIQGNDVWHDYMKELEWLNDKTGQIEKGVTPNDIYSNPRKIKISLSYKKNKDIGFLKKITLFDNSDNSNKKLILEIERYIALEKNDSSGKKKEEVEYKSFIDMTWFYQDGKFNRGIHFLKYSEKEQGMPIINFLQNFTDIIGKEIFLKKLKTFDKEGINVFIEEFHKRLFGLMKRFVYISEEKTIIEYDQFITEKYLSKNLKVKDLFLNDKDELYKDYLQITGNISLQEIIKISDLSKIFEYTSKHAENITNHLVKFFDIEYLEAQKSNAQRIYMRQYQGSAMNTLLEEFRKRDFKDDNESKKIKFINYWMGKEGFNYGTDLEFFWPIHGVEVKLTKNGRKTDLADLGYGTNQMLALLLKIVLIDLKDPNCPGGAVLMLEEPEINLHPNLQSKLADMFIDAYKKFRINFIIETHSEYLIRKLQFLTAKKVIKPEDTVIHYFINPEDLYEGDEQIKKINIREKGVLTQDFGTGFLDEANKIAIDIFLFPDSQKN